jgi:hypothetical protein
MAEQTLQTMSPQSTPAVAPLQPDQQILQSTVLNPGQQMSQPPDFGDMVRGLLTQNLPDFIVNVHNTITGSVIAIQDKLSQQQVANTELSFQGAPERPTMAINSQHMNSAYENTGLREILTRDVIAVAQQNNIDSITLPDGARGRGNEFFTNLGFTTTPTLDLNLDLRDPIQANQLQTQLQTVQINPEQLQAVRSEMGISPGSTTQDVVNQRGFESALWLTSKLGKENHMGSTTCVLDQQDKSFMILGKDNSPILTYQNGQLQGNMTTAQANAFGRSKGEHMLTMQQQTSKVNNSVASMER